MKGGLGFSSEAKTPMYVPTCLYHLRKPGLPLLLPTPCMSVLGLYVPRALWYRVTAAPAQVSLYFRWDRPSLPPNITAHNVCPLYACVTPQPRLEHAPQNSFLDPAIQFSEFIIQSALVNYRLAAQASAETPPPQ